MLLLLISTMTASTDQYQSALYASLTHLYWLEGPTSDDHEVASHPTLMSR